MKKVATLIISAFLFCNADGMNVQEESLESICGHISTLTTGTLAALNDLRGHHGSGEAMQTAANSLESTLRDVGHPEYIVDSNMPRHYSDDSHYKDMQPGHEKELLAAKIIEETFAAIMGHEAGLLKILGESLESPEELGLSITDNRREAITLSIEFETVKRLGYIPLRLFVAGSNLCTVANDFFLAHPNQRCLMRLGMTRLPLEDAPNTYTNYESSEIIREHITTLTAKAKEAFTSLGGNEDIDSTITILEEALRSVGHPEYIPQEGHIDPLLLCPNGYKDMAAGEAKTRFSANFTQFVIMFHMAISINILRETTPDDLHTAKIVEILQSLEGIIRRHVQAGSELTAPINDFFQAYPDPAGNGVVTETEDENHDDAV